jgi:ABC-type multidrug transport system fused ATPase/permease subunit
MAFFDQNASGKLISRCVNDVTNLSSFFTANFFTVIADFALIIGATLFMFTISPGAALIVTAMILPLTIFMLNVSQAQMRWGRDQRNLLSRLSSHTADTMNNLAVLHSQDLSDKWSKRHSKLQDIFSGFTIRNILTWGSFSSTHVFIMGITYASVITLGVYNLQNGSMTIGNMIASFTYVGLIFGPFIEISEKLNMMVTALGSVKRLRGLLPEKINQVLEAPKDTAPAPNGNIIFKDIFFSYRYDTYLFENFNLTIPEGEVTALVGRTGSGKTTLAQLMLGLYPINSGKILWGDEDLTTLNSTRRARWISHVSQDLFVFTDTIRENLRMWNEEISDELIWDRLKLVGLQEKIASFEDKLDMIVKAETLPLSQGEKQLLLLCRALLQDPKLLVFDEATANLDQLTEEEWLKNVGLLFQGRTTLFIAHRIETLRLATNIVVLENGKILKTFRKPKGNPVTEKELH